MYLPDFTYHKPKTLNTAYEILNSSKNAAPIAGGTDILVEMKQGIRQLDDVISLNEIIELQTIEENEDHVLIGPCATHSQIENSPIIKKYIPALAGAVSTIGTHQIRNTGTIGGNLCTCASCADTAPILIAYNAEVEIGSAGDNRILNLTDFLINHHKTSLKQGELLTKIIVPKPKSNTGAHFEKFGLRASASISVASVAVSITVENGKINNANIVIGACAPTPLKSPAAIKELIDNDIIKLEKGSELLKRIGKAAASDVLPIDDLRGSAEYRRNIVEILTQRVVLKAIENISFSPTVRNSS